MTADIDCGSRKLDMWVNIAKQIEHSILYTYYTTITLCRLNELRVISGVKRVADKQ